MHEKEQLRATVRDNLGNIISKMNSILAGKDVSKLEPVLTRIGRGGIVPHWYRELKSDGVLPNLDGKTIGSVVEMVFVAVLETSALRASGIGQLRVNPARGVDLPDLHLGVKSPSKNYCTSEPFLSAYHRMLGSEYDVVVLLTDYQIKKKSPPLRLQIVDSRYLTKSQVADRGLCSVARKHRKWLLDSNLDNNQARLKKLFRFLAYINQSDWRARWLLKLVDAMQDEAAVARILDKCNKDFAQKNKVAMKKDTQIIPVSELNAINEIPSVNPIYVSIIDAADNWVLEVLKEAARAPNDNEWQRFLDSPLDGLIGMSFALQWRYNFGQLFGKKSHENKPVEIKL